MERVVRAEVREDAIARTLVCSTVHTILGMFVADLVNDSRGLESRPQFIDCMGERERERGREGKREGGLERGREKGLEGGRR